MQSEYKILKSVIRIRNSLHYSDQSECKLEFLKRYEHNNQYLSIAIKSEIGCWYSISMLSPNYTILRFEINHNVLIARGRNFNDRCLKITEYDLKDIVDMDDLHIALTYRKDLTDGSLLKYSFRGAEDLFLDFAKSTIFGV